MNNFISFIILSGFLCLGIISTLVVGLVKGNKTLLLTSAGLIVLLALLINWVGPFINAISQDIKAMKTSERAYNSFFGKDRTECVKIIKDFCGIDRGKASGWIEMQTCPLEIRRILSLQQYSKDHVASNTTQQLFPAMPDVPWFKLANLGDSIIQYQTGNALSDSTHVIWTNMDSTRAIMLFAEREL